MKKAKQGKEEEAPQIIAEKGTLSAEELSKMAQKLNSDDNELYETLDEGADNSETLFTNVINRMNSDIDIDMKTEYNEDQIFASSKGTFISLTCNVPMIDAFLRRFERKLLSKNRKSRVESLLALQRRNEEEEARLKMEVGAR